MTGNGIIDANGNGNGNSNGSGNGYLPDGEIVSKPIGLNGHDAGSSTAELLDSTLTYAQSMGPKLRERVARFRRVGVSLLDELALVRVMADDAIGTYQKSLSAADNLVGDNVESKRMAIGAAAASYLMQALNNVKDMAISAHRVMSNEVLDPRAVQAVIFQTIKVIDSEVQREALEAPSRRRGPKSFVDRVTRAIDETVGLGDRSLEFGTEITPENSQVQLDAEVRAMHDTVPRSQTA